MPILTPPRLDKSAFNRYLLSGAIKDNHAQAAHAPGAPGIIPVRWPDYFGPDGAFNAAMSGMLARWEADMVTAKKINTDSRYTPEGRKSKGAALLNDLFVQNRTLYVGQPKGVVTPGVNSVLSMIAANAREAAKQIDAMKVQKPTSADAGPEWRAFLRGLSRGERMLTIRALVRDGNGNLIPAIADADHALSGVDQEQKATINNYGIASANIEAIKAHWANAEAMAAMRLICIRAVVALTAAAGLEPDVQAAAEAAASNTPDLDVLTQKISAIDDAVEFLHGQISVVPEQFKNTEA